MINIEVKYASTKEQKEEQLQSVFIAIGTERLEKNDFINLIPNTEEHNKVLDYLLDVIINPLDSDVMNIAFLTNYLVEYRQLNQMIAENKSDVKTYLQLNKAKNECVSKCQKIIQQFCLTPATRKNLLMIWENESDGE